MNKAELILSPEGEIFHLKLKPGQLATNIITVGDPKRIDLLEPYFDSVSVRVSNREFSVLTGEIHGHPLSVLATGIGTDNIDIALTEADALFNIDFETYTVKEELTALTFIRLGTSGGLQKDIEPGDIVLSQAAMGMDNLLYFYEDSRTSDWKKVDEKAKQLLQLKTYTIPADTELFNHFSSIGVKGITLTCPGFYGPQGRQLRAPNAFPNYLEDLSHLEFPQGRITNFEMETAGIYAMASILGHKALSINAILASRSKGTFAEQPHEVVEHMIEKAMEKLILWLD